MPEAARQAGLPGTEAAVPRLLAWEPAQLTLAAGWEEPVRQFFASPAGLRLSAFLRERLAAGAVVYPPQPLRALALTPLASVHAVVVGQDPYHGPGQAEGLAFSVPAGVRIPPSLRNIYKELGSTSPDGSLLHWAAGGVLLLNTCLTVEQGRAGSHAGQGWEALTDLLLEQVAATASPCVYFLWGAHAQAKEPLIRQAALARGRECLILQANHPSPLSAARPPVPFLGSGHFATARQWLRERGVEPVF